MIYVVNRIHFNGSHKHVLSHSRLNPLERQGYVYFSVSRLTRWCTLEKRQRLIHVCYVLDYVVVYYISLDDIMIYF